MYWRLNSPRWRGLALWMLLALVLAPVLCPRACADEGPRALPGSAWQLLQQAQGIWVGPDSASYVSMQVIFDTNCPYCARLYQSMRMRHADVRVRWVPIAYLKGDSSAVAARILGAADPAGLLDVNFMHYNHRAHHGGIHVSMRRPPLLPRTNAALRSHWVTWGGFTPMVVYKDPKGVVFHLALYDESSLRRALGDVSQELVPYGK